MILSVKNLSKFYYQGEEKIIALQDISFDLQKGETLAIVGPSGSGKTTLLSLLAGLEEVSSGSINIAGQRIDCLTEKNLTQFRARHIGIIFQQFHLMPHLTAIENVRLPLDIQRAEKSDESALSALKSVGLENRQKHFPRQLSGGESQRLAIARAIVIQPTILFADEPSGNLDQATGESVMNMVFSLVKTQKMTLVLVTHDSELAEKCDHRLFLKGGRMA